MSLLDAIISLEDIKKKYIIKKLENFTEQLAATTTSATTAAATTAAATTATPPSTTSTTSPPATTSTTSPPATTSTTSPPATTPPKKEDDKTLPVGTAKKFEKNIMDSLKWVFIGIGIFVLLLFIFGIIYWLMSGNRDDQNLNTMNEEINYENIPKPLIAATTLPLVSSLSTTTKIPNDYNDANDNKNNSIFSFMSPLSKKEEVPEIIKNQDLNINKTIIPESSSSSPIPQNKNDSIFSFMSSFTKKDDAPEIIKNELPKSSSSSSSSSSLTTSTSSSSLSSLSSSSSSIPQNNKNDSMFSFMSSFSKKDDDIDINKSKIPELSSSSSISKNIKDALEKK